MSGLRLSKKTSRSTLDWECPSCGKAYTKTAHESPGTSLGYVRPYPANSPKKNRPTVWGFVSLLLGVACVPFVLAWLWIVAIEPFRETSHPVPPDRVIAVIVDRGKSGTGGRLAYMTAAELKRENELGKLLLFPGSIVGVAFVVARNFAKREQDK